MREAKSPPFPTRSQTLRQKMSLKEWPHGRSDDLGRIGNAMFRQINCDIIKHSYVQFSSKLCARGMMYVKGALLRPNDHCSGGPAWPELSSVDSLAKVRFWSHFPTQFSVHLHVGHQVTARSTICWRTILPISRQTLPDSFEYTNSATRLSLLISSQPPSKQSAQTSSLALGEVYF